MIERRGEKLAVSVDETGDAAPAVSARCTHLGCTVGVEPGRADLRLPVPRLAVLPDRRGRERPGRDARCRPRERGRQLSAAGRPSGRGSRRGRSAPIADRSCARRAIAGSRCSSSSETRGTPDGRTSHASFTRAKYGRAIALIRPMMASEDHDRQPEPPVVENAANLSPSEHTGHDDRADRDVHRQDRLAGQRDEIDDLLPVALAPDPVEDRHRDAVRPEQREDRRRCAGRAATGCTSPRRIAGARSDLRRQKGS